MISNWIDDSLIFSGVKGYIDTLSENMKLPAAIVIQNMTIRRIAEEDATAAVYGEREKLLSEFMSSNGELITGQELYDIIFKHEKKRLEGDYIESILSRLSTQDGGHCEAGLRFYNLPADEQEILKRYKLDPVSQIEKKTAEMEIKKLQESGEIGEVETTWNNKE